MNNLEKAMGTTFTANCVKPMPSSSMPKEALKGFEVQHSTSCNCKDCDCPGDM